VNHDRLSALQCIFGSNTEFPSNSVKVTYWRTQLRRWGQYTPDKGSGNIMILTHTCGGRATHDPSDHPGKPSAHDYYMLVDAVLTVVLSQGLET